MKTACYTPEITLTTGRSSLGERRINYARGPVEHGFTPGNTALRAGVKRLQKCITVLLAEERTIIRQGIGALLDRQDNIAVVGQAPSYEQVAQMAEELRPDVVIIAFNMALRNGVEAIRRLLGNLCGARMLVLVPQDNNNAFGDHIAASGAAGYLSEEANSQVLESAVREVHESNHFYPSGGSHRLESLQPSSPQFQGLRDRCVAQLTSRELEVLQLIAEGNANKNTAAKLGISIKTVEKHRQSLMDKLRIHDTATLTRYALYAGITR